MSEPTIGRIVHYVMQNGEHRPAIVVHVFDDNVVNLQVFTDCANDNFTEGTQNVIWRTSVRLHTVLEGVPDAPGTWHWPEQWSEQI